MTSSIPGSPRDARPAATPTTRARASRFAILALLALLLSAGTAAAQTADDLFRRDVLHDIQITVSTRDLQQLIVRYEENTYYTADITWRGVRFRNAGVRVRGRSSRVQGKPGLELQFSRYVPQGRFLGLDTLVLDNLWQDQGMVAESMTMAMFERIGIASPRESFARVFLNGTYYGVYGVLEQPDQSFLERQFTDGEGFLYEFHPGEPYYGQDLGDDYDAYKPAFEPRTHRRDADSTLYGPIRTLVKEANLDVDAVWRERVQQSLDLEQFVRYVAVETFMAEPDGILGSNGMSNFYLYRPAGSSQHRLIPWDKDLSFDNPEFDLFRRADQNEIFKRAIAIPELMDLYLATLESCARTALEEDWLRQEVDRSIAVVADAAHQDTRKSASNDEFDARADYLRAFASSRPGFVLQLVAEARRAPGRE